MQANLFFGGELTSKELKQGNSYYWVKTKLIKESGPWYTVDGVKSPHEVYEVAKELDMEELDKEHFVAIYLDRKNKINAASVISIGDVYSTIVHPREVFKPAILCNASAMILIHNHPSGDPSASAEDIEITNRLIEVGKIVGIEIIDHIIVGDCRYISMREKGHI